MLNVFYYLINTRSFNFPVIASLYNFYYTVYSSGIY